MNAMQPPQSVEEIKAGLETTEKGGVRQSIRNCLTVFQRDPLLSAAQGGNAACMMNTAILYARGEGTPHNAREALYWAEQAKKHGAPQAEQLINAIKKNG